MVICCCPIISILAVDVKFTPFAKAAPLSIHKALIPVALEIFEPTLPPSSVTIKFGEPAKVPSGLLYCIEFTAPFGVPPAVPFAAAVTRPNPSTVILAFVYAPAVGAGAGAARLTTGVVPAVTAI